MKCEVDLFARFIAFCHGDKYAIKERWDMEEGRRGVRVGEGTKKEREVQSECEMSNRMWHQGNKSESKGKSGRKTK